MHLQGYQFLGVTIMIRNLVCSCVYRYGKKLCPFFGCRSEVGMAPCVSAVLVIHLIVYTFNSTEDIKTSVCSATGPTTGQNTHKQGRYAGTFGRDGVWSQRITRCTSVHEQQSWERLCHACSTVCGLWQQEGCTAGAIIVTTPTDTSSLSGPIQT